MKFKPLPTLTFILIFTVKTLAQSSSTENVIIKGIVLGEETNQSLAYVSVGVWNNSQGTLTDTTCKFSFSINQAHLSDTLQISLVG